MSSKKTDKRRAASGAGARPGESSIIKKINRRIQLRRLVRMLSALLWTGLAVLLSWCISAEAQAGPLRFLQYRTLSIPEQDSFFKTLRGLCYGFSPSGSTEVFTVKIGQILCILWIALPVLSFLLLIRWNAGWKRNASFLREVLRPVNEAALRAQQIADDSIDPRQLHNMEQVLDSITDSNSRVSIGDADLQGVEFAINRLLERLKASYAEQTRFVDDASHELRTPIAVIHGYSSILDRWGKDDPATLDESVKAILEESEHMQVLVDQLLFLARGDGGRQKLRMESLELQSMMREIAEESRMIDETHLYEYREASPVYAAGDAAMLKQAVRILVDNAAKYTEKGGRILLSAGTLPDGRTELRVQDEGTGLRAQEASHMFERFFRGDAVRGSTKGSGLGLSIAKWIVDHHGGSIEVCSFPEVGTRMSICLPGR